MRKSAWMAPIVAASLAVSVAGAANAAPDENSATRAPQSGTSVEYAPEEYFRAFYFGTGPVAQMLPEIKEAADISGSSTPEAMRAQDEVLESIEASDPSYFPRFASAVTSGKHLKVETALQEGSEKLYDGLEQTDPNFARPEEGAVTPQACSIALACAVTVVVAVSYAGAVSVALAVFAWVKVKGPKSAAMDDGSLIQRTVVQQAVDNLA